MVSKVIKEAIERIFGREIRYPSDCDALASDMSHKCNAQISASTMKRFFGFTKFVEPRLYTLDVVAKYVGYKNWDDYLEKLAGKSESSEFVKLEELQILSLQERDRYEFRYEPARIVRFEYMGSGLCKVFESENSKLQTNDLFRASHIVLQYPFLISSVVRGNQNLGALTLGKVSGITSIRKL